MKKSKVIKLNILFIVIVAALYSLTIFSVFSLSTNAFSTDILLACEEISNYLQRENEEKTFAKISSIENGRDTYFLRDYVRSMVHGGKHVINNKMHYFAEPSDTFAPLEIDLPVTSEVIKPNILILPYQDVEQNFFKFKLMPGQSWFQKNMEIVASNLFVTKVFADKIIAEFNLVKDDYTQLIGYGFNGKYDNGKTNSSRKFSIAGVIDSDAPEFAFYRQAYGEELCVAPFISQKNYYGNVSIVFELGKNENENISFLKTAIKRIKSDFSFTIYEKETDHYSLGRLMAAYLHGQRYFDSKENKIVSIKFAFFAFFSFAFLVISVFLLIYITKKNPLTLSVITFFYPLLFLLLQICLVPVFHYSKGVDLTNSFFRRYDNPFATIISLITMITVIFTTLIVEKITIIKRIKSTK